MSDEELPHCKQGIDPLTLARWRDQDLDAATTTVIAAHIPACMACQAHLRTFEEDGWRLRHMRELVPGQRIWSGVRASIIAGATRRRPIMDRRIFGGLSAAVALIIIFPLLFQVVRGVTGRSTTIALTMTPTLIAGQISLPDFVGKSWGDIKTFIHQSSLNVLVTKAACPTDPLNSVHDQKPPAGTVVAPDATVTIILCAGSDYVAVPDVTGKTFTDACNILKHAGLLCQRVSRSNRTVPAGQVIATNPATGGDARQGDVVTIIVSTGAIVAAPVVFNDPQAASALRFAGFTDNIVTVYVGNAMGQAIAFAAPIAGVSWSADQSSLLVLTGTTYGQYQAFLVPATGGQPRAIPEGPVQDATHLQDCVQGCQIVADRYLLYPIFTSAHFQSFGVLDVLTGAVLATNLDHLPYTPIVHGSDVYILADAPNQCNATIVERVALPSGSRTTVATLPGVTSNQGIAGAAVAIAADGQSMIFRPLASAHVNGTPCPAAPNYAPLIYSQHGQITPLSAHPVPSLLSLAPDGRTGFFSATDSSVTPTKTTNAQQALPNGARITIGLPANANVFAAQWTSDAILIFTTTGNKQAGGSEPNTMIVYKAFVGDSGPPTIVATITLDHVALPAFA